MNCMAPPIAKVARPFALTGTRYFVRFRTLDRTIASGPSFIWPCNYLPFGGRIARTARVPRGISLSQSGLCLWRRWSTLADVIAPTEAKVNALEERRHMIEIELTKPQSVRCSRSKPAQGNLLHKGASQNGAVSACGEHGAALGCEPTRWSQPTRSCWPKQMGC